MTLMLWTRVERIHLHNLILVYFLRQLQDSAIWMKCFVKKYNTTIIQIIKCYLEKESKADLRRIASFHLIRIVPKISFSWELLYP